MGLPNCIQVIINCMIKYTVYKITGTTILKASFEYNTLYLFLDVKINLSTVDIISSV